MAYSENFPKARKLRTQPIGSALASNKFRNTTNKKYYLPPRKPKDTTNEVKP